MKGIENFCRHSTMKSNQNISENKNHMLSVVKLQFSEFFSLLYITCFAIKENYSRVNIHSCAMKPNRNSLALRFLNIFHSRFWSSQTTMFHPRSVYLELLTPKVTRTNARGSKIDDDIVSLTLKIFSLLGFIAKWADVINWSTFSWTSIFVSNRNEFTVINIVLMTVRSRIVVFHSSDDVVSANGINSVLVIHNASFDSQMSK